VRRHVLCTSTTPIADDELLVLFQKDDKTRRIRRDRRTTPEADFAKYTCAYYTHARYVPVPRVQYYNAHASIRRRTRKSVLLAIQFDRYRHRHRAPIDGVVQTVIKIVCKCRTFICVSFAYPCRRQLTGDETKNVMRRTCEIDQFPEQIAILFCATVTRIRRREIDRFGFCLRRICNVFSTSRLALVIDSNKQF